MAYRRYYRRPLGRSRYIRAPRNKYSVEQKTFRLVPSATAVNTLYQVSSPVVESVDIQGTRKVKHLTINLTPSNQGGTGTDTIGPIYWALVYVPQGTIPGSLALNASMYEPNQYVMNCGVVDPSAGPIRFSSPVSRNLNSGDSIYLLIGGVSYSATDNYYGTVRYAITLN